METIDLSVLDGLTETVGEDFMGELIDTFLEEAPGMIAEMEQALSADDADKFRRAAHSLKSNASTFGAMELAERARELEYMARENDLDIGNELQILNETYENAAKELKSLR
ncbi:MAG: Hpt domain-containing protein [Anaerolineales bacterium]|jgi:HPt (histidine-containing phosphotransfer) domain-containing protein